MSSANGMNRDSGNVEWYTPKWLIDLVSQFYDGQIDLDPASSYKANQTVWADTYFDERENGLDEEWWGNVWLNHPYGRKKNEEWSLAICENSVWAKQILGICYNSMSERWCNRIIKNADAICNISPRVAFINGKTGTAQGSCQKGSILYYFGPKVDKFARMFNGDLYIDKVGKRYEGTVLVRHQTSQPNGVLPGQMKLI